MFCRFERLLDALDAQREELKIDSYGISGTSMEEVFLKASKVREDGGDDNVSEGAKSGAMPVA